MVTGHVGDPSLPGVDWEALGRLGRHPGRPHGHGARADIADGSWPPAATPTRRWPSSTGARPTASRSCAPTWPTWPRSTCRPRPPSWSARSPVSTCTAVGPRPAGRAEPVRGHDPRAGRRRTRRSRVPPPPGSLAGRTRGGHPGPGPGLGPRRAAAPASGPSVVELPVIAIDDPPTAARRWPPPPTGSWRRGLRLGRVHLGQRRGPAGGRPRRPGRAGGDPVGRGRASTAKALDDRAASSPTWCPTTRCRTPWWPCSRRPARQGAAPGRRRGGRRACSCGPSGSATWSCPGCGPRAGGSTRSWPTARWPATSDPEPWPGAAPPTPWPSPRRRPSSARSTCSGPTGCPPVVASIGPVTSGRGAGGRAGRHGRGGRPTPSTGWWRAGRRLGGPSADRGRRRGTDRAGARGPTASVP